jgi:hypothetical protein
VALIQGRYLVRVFFEVDSICRTRNKHREAVIPVTTSGILGLPGAVSFIPAILENNYSFEQCDDIFKPGQLQVFY